MPSPTSCPRVVDHLRAFLGEWRIESVLPLDPPVVRHGRTVFEAMPGGHYLLQLWEGDDVDTASGVAIITFHADNDTYEQHSFDEHGVVRVYGMTFYDGVWRLWRDAPGLSQCFTGVFSSGGRTIEGRWEKSGDDGATWEHDADVTFTKVR